jgi:hypothetical protein
MTAIEQLIEPKSAPYTKLREELRGKAQAYALDRVGGSKTNQRARTMLAAAFDHGVSAMVERARAALISDDDDEQESSGYNRAMEAMFAYCLAVGEEEVIETIEALSEGRAKIIAVLPSERTRERSGPSDGALGTRTGRLAAPDGGREGSLGVATDGTESDPEDDGDFSIAQEEMESNEYRDHPGPFWKVGDCCVWTKRHELGVATIKWIGSNRKPVAARRCKLEYKKLDRVMDAYLDELEPVGER